MLSLQSGMISVNKQSPFVFLCKVVSLMLSAAVCISCGNSNPPSHSCVAATIPKKYLANDKSLFLGAKFISSAHSRVELDAAQPLVAACNAHIVNRDVMFKHYPRTMKLEKHTDMDLSFYTASHCFRMSLVPSYQLAFSWRGTAYSVNLLGQLQREKNWIETHDMTAAENKSFLSLVTQDYFGFADLDWRTGFNFSEGVAQRVRDRIESDKKEQKSAFSAGDMVFVSMKIAPETPAASKSALHQALEFYGSNLAELLKVQDREKIKINDDFLYSLSIFTGFEQRKNFSFHSLFVLQECLKEGSILQKRELEDVCSKADYKLKELKDLYPGIASVNAKEEFMARLDYLTTENGLNLKANADLRNSIGPLAANDYLLYAFSGNGYSSYGGYDMGKLKKDKELKIQPSGRIEISSDDLQSGVELVQGDSGSLLTIFGVFPVATLLRAGGEFSSGGWPVQFIPKESSPQAVKKDATILVKPGANRKTTGAGQGEPRKETPKIEGKKRKGVPVEETSSENSNSSEPKQRKEDNNIAARDVSGAQPVNESIGREGSNSCY